MRGPKPQGVVLELQQRERLQAYLRRGKTEWRCAQRARILLQLANGENPCRIAQVAGCSVRTVSRIRERFDERGLEALHDLPRSGRPPEIPPPSPRPASLNWPVWNLLRSAST